MTRYLIEAPHTKEECLRNLDQTLAKGPEILDKFYFGCNYGEHTAWAIVDAESRSEAEKLLSDVVIRRRARIVEVGKSTPQEIRSMHEG